LNLWVFASAEVNVQFSKWRDERLSALAVSDNQFDVVSAGFLFENVGMFFQRQTVLDAVRMVHINTNDVFLLGFGVLNDQLRLLDLSNRLLVTASKLEVQGKFVLQAIERYRIRMWCCTVQFDTLHLLSLGIECPDFSVLDLDVALHIDGNSLLYQYVPLVIGLHGELQLIGPSLSAPLAKEIQVKVGLGCLGLLQLDLGVLDGPALHMGALRQGDFEVAGLDFLAKDIADLQTDLGIRAGDGRGFGKVRQACADWDLVRIVRKGLQSIHQVCAGCFILH
jgi:hypothetical protein